MFSCPVVKLPVEEAVRGGDDDVWIWRIWCAPFGAGSSCASHPLVRNRHPGGSAAGASGSSARGGHSCFVGLNAVADREVSARSSRTPHSIQHLLRLQLRPDADAESGSCGDHVDHQSRAQTCAGGRMI